MGDGVMTKNRQYPVHEPYPSDGRRRRVDPAARVQTEDARTRVVVSRRCDWIACAPPVFSEAFETSVSSQGFCLLPYQAGRLLLNSTSPRTWETALSTLVALTRDAHADPASSVSRHRASRLIWASISPVVAMSLAMSNFALFD